MQKLTDYWEDAKFYFARLTTWMGDHLMESTAVLAALMLLVIVMSHGVMALFGAFFGGVLALSIFILVIEKL